MSVFSGAKAVQGRGEERKRKKTNATKASGAQRLSFSLLRHCLQREGHEAQAWLYGVEQKEKPFSHSKPKRELKRRTMGTKMSLTPEHSQRCSSLCRSALFPLEFYADVCCVSPPVSSLSSRFVLLSCTCPSKEILRR